VHATALLVAHSVIVAGCALARYRTTALQGRSRCMGYIDNFHRLPRIVCPRSGNQARYDSSTASIVYMLHHDNLLTAILQLLNGPSALIEDIHQARCGAQITNMRVQGPTR
jgi:hypothetical protein